jgi:hypothetical protein
MNLLEKTPRSDPLSTLRLGPASAGPFVWNHCVLLDYFDSPRVTYSFFGSSGLFNRSSSITTLLKIHMS